jgi:hypothetical protein
LRRRQIGAAHFDLRLQRPAIERHEQLARIDMIAVAHEDFLDHPDCGNSELHGACGRRDAGGCLCHCQGGH